MNIEENKSYLEKRGISSEVAKEWNLEDIPEKKIVKINYPHKDGSYNFCQYRYYGNKPNIAKYFFPKDLEITKKKSILYGLQKYDTDDIKYLGEPSLLMEGALNTISATLMGYQALGMPGQTFKLGEDDYNYFPINSKVIILYDAIDFALERAKEIREKRKDLKIFIAQYENDMDANNYLVQSRKEDFDRIIRDAKSYDEIISTTENNQVKRYEVGSIEVPEDDFITYYCDEYACKSTDAPRKYQELMALAVISVVLNRKVYLPYSVNNLYPNLFVVLIGKSTIMRKSVSLNLARNLIFNFNKEFIFPHDFTQEGFFEHLKEFSKGIIIWSEFAGFLQKSTKPYMAGTKEFLTDAFDCPIYLNKKLAGKKIFEIENPYINIITATSMKWFTENITEADVKGGFLGRFIYILALPNDKDKWFAFPAVPNQNVINRLLIKLRGISELEGQMELTEKAKETYIDWLKNHEDELQRLSDDKGISSFYGRLSDYTLKFAILYELSSNLSLTISDNSIKRAIRLVESLKESIRDVLEKHVSFTAYEKNKKKILRIIGDKKEIARGELIKSSGLNKKDFDLVIDTLLEEETIKVKPGESKYKPKTIYFKE